MMMMLSKYTIPTHRFANSSIICIRMLIHQRMRMFWFLYKLLCFVSVIDFARCRNHHQEPPMSLQPRQLDGVEYGYDDVRRRSNESSIVINKIHDDISSNNLERSLQSACVQDGNQLKSAIINAPDYPTTPTRINLCSSYITIDARVQGIYIAKKCLEIFCTMTVKCTLDAQNFSRLFMIQFTSDIYFQNIIFANGNAIPETAYPHGGSIYVDGGSKLKFKNCDFVRSKAEQGGAFRAFSSTLTFIGPNSITDNVASLRGGFIHAQGVFIQIENYNIIGNRAPSGGAFSLSNCTLNLIGSVGSTPTEIRNNEASSIGGFVDAFDNSIIQIYNNCVFSNNRATYGGAISLFGSTLRMYGSNINSAQNRIFNNTALADGGFIRAHIYSTVEIHGYSLINNMAIFGGAISLFETNFKMYANDNDALSCEIRNNKATEWGGFIAVQRNSIVEIHNCNFFSNSARYGGVISIENQYSIFNNKAQFGGAIFIKESSMLTMFGSNSDTSIAIQNNIATGSGGFMACYSNSVIEIHQYNFINNKAPYGGVINLEESNLSIFGIDIGTPNVIQNNAATEHGGFLRAYYSSSIQIYNYSFISNSAKYGGVISISSSNIKIYGNNNKSFNNTATVDGGLVYAIENSNIQIHGCHLINNSATKYGSTAFFIQDSDLIIGGHNDSMMPTEFEIDGDILNVF